MYSVQCTMYIASIYTGCEEYKKYTEYEEYKEYSEYEEYKAARQPESQPEPASQSQPEQTRYFPPGSEAQILENQGFSNPAEGISIGFATRFEKRLKLFLGSFQTLPEGPL